MLKHLKNIDKSNYFKNKQEIYISPVPNTDQYLKVQKCNSKNYWLLLACDIIPYGSICSLSGAFINNKTLGNCDRNYIDKAISNLFHFFLV